MPANAACSSCGKPVHRGKKSRPEIICRECRRERPATPRRRSGRRRFPQPKAADEAVRHQAGDHSLCDPDRPGHGVCSECRATVAVSRSSAPPERRRCRDCQRARRDNLTRACGQCGKDFQPRSKGKNRPPQAFCSRSCAALAGNIARGGTRRGRPRTWADLSEAARQRKRQKARARRLSHLATWDGVTDEAILERDRWMCGICGKRIGKTFSYPHPRSKSIDHVIPLSEGGDDTAANKRAAHLSCNTGRGNRGGGEQLALVG